MNTEKSWFALKITVAADAAEAIEFALNELDALGTEINNLGVKQTETLGVAGYFHELPADESVQTKLIEALRIYGFAPEAILEIDRRKIGDVDWLFEWKKHWKATETGKFVVAPSWENLDDSDKIIIRIEPNMAFGTGTHETTRLCLQAIEETYNGESFLDVGTGTGILAIAAAKSNAEDENQKPSIFGYDTDFDSIKIAAENAETNEVGEKIEFRVGSISEIDAEYDFVCANITIDIIIPLFPMLLGKSKQILVLSGILREQENQILAELEKFNIENPKIERLGEWISVTIKK